MKWEFGDLNNGIIFFNTGFDYGALSPARTPPSSTAFNFNGSYIKSRENLDLEYIFVNEINNEMVNENEWEFGDIKCENKNKNNCGELYRFYRPTPESTDTLPIIDLISSGVGLVKNPDLKYVLGVKCNQIEFDCNINNEKIIFENENEMKMIVLNYFGDYIIQQYIQHHKYLQQQLILVILVLNHVKIMII